ncbi:hypothetical protein ONE63_008229 [Megalurothrips usitatus]|uniref:Uncharacterized protein n=1 Tax=Megalurothrips usitatus TaxID=439358 RepID=A0AAV7XPL8_9NEOP|nr:hypothetical protein ONE63_008229 [Megalurothrips usitatus]
MAENQDFCLRWSSYSQQLSEALRSLLDRELLVDVTLACDGRSLRAHRAILSACSSYFQELFQESTHPHPIVILKDVKYEELEALVKFMYHGEVTVNNDILPGFLRTAETLHVRGLTDNTSSCSTSTLSSLNTADDLRASDEEAAPDMEGGSTLFHRISPVPLKRVKLEQPSTSQYQNDTRRLSEHQDPDPGLNGSGADDGNISEQNTQCSVRSEDLTHIRQDQYTVQRNVTTLDGLNQLVMPVIQDDPMHTSQYIGGSSSIQHQLHQLPPHQQSLPHHLIAQHTTNTTGNLNCGTGRPFRQRVLYNQEQLLQLEAWYRQDRYPSGTLMREYADALAAMVPNTPGSIGAQPMRQNVDYWFQNRRRRDSHPEVMQQREKKKLAKTLWGNHNGNNANPGVNPESNVNVANSR